MQIRRNEVLTGLLVVATLAVLTGILVLLGAPGLFRPLTTYKIYFDNAAGIKQGAPVLLAGRKIGQVANLYSPVSKEESQRAVEVAKSLRAAEANASRPQLFLATRQMRHCHRTNHHRRKTAPGADRQQPGPAKANHARRARVEPIRAPFVDWRAAK